VKESATLEHSCPLSDQEVLDSIKIAIEDNPLRLIEADKYLYIKTKDGRMIILRLNSAQKILYNTIKKLRQAKKRVRILLLKYRQGGMSTLIESILYSLTSQQSNRNSLIIADEKEHANNLFEMSKLYQEKLEEHHPYLPPPLKRSNEKKLEFEGLHSQIIVASGENKEAAKSHTFQYVHISEAAYFSYLRTVLDDLNQTVPDFWDTIIILETTANAMEEFHKMWKAAKSGFSDWVPVFLPWFLMEEYRMPLQDGKLYPLDSILFPAESSALRFEEDEQKLKKEYKLDDEQLNWRRWAIVNKCNGSILTFKREYPADDEEAFSTSGSLFFDKDGLKKQIIKKPIAIGELFFEDLKWQFRDLPHGRIKIYERPELNEQYVVAGDASEAVGEDEAAALVLNKRLNTVCATIAGQHTPEDLAQLEIALGHFYNKAIIAQENKGYGYQVNQLIFKNYGNIYRKMINKDGIDTPTDELGFNTNSVSRPQILALMADEIKCNSCSLYSKELIDECYSFVIKRNEKGEVTKIEAQDGVRDGKKLYQDGLLICRAIAGFIRNKFPYLVLKTKDIHAKQKALIKEKQKQFRSGG